MQKKIICFLTLLLCVAASGKTLWASTQLQRIMDFNRMGLTTPVAVRNASRNDGQAVWPSTFQGETKQFEGYFIATSDQTKLAVRSDDGVSIFKDGTSILGNVGVGQRWNADSSFFDLGGDWTKNVPCKIVVDYKNTQFSGNDADGVSLLPYNGNGRVVTVDLDLGGVTGSGGEDNEELIPALAPLNDDADEGNTNVAGKKVGDNIAGTAGDRIVATDNELQTATLKLNGELDGIDLRGKWKLTFPDSVKLWRQDGANWIQVVSGAESAEVALPYTVALKVEGISIGSGDIVGSLKLTNPAAAASIEDKAKFSIFKINLTANSLKMGDDGFLVTAQEAEVSEVDEESVGAFVHFNMDDDNNSDTVRWRTAGVPKYPGGDAAENAAPVTGEDDLMICPPNSIQTKG